MALTKVCKLCRVDLPIDAFRLVTPNAPENTGQKGGDGRRGRCYECEKKRARELRAEASRKRVAGEPNDLADDDEAEELETAPEPVPMIESMLSFGSSIERASVESLLRCGSVDAAAKDLQLEPRQLRAHLEELERKAARRGWAPDLDLTKQVPPGYHLKGASTYYDKFGVKRGQWVKSQKDQDDKISMMLDALSSVADSWRDKADPVVLAADTQNEDLLAVYPMGDPHLGMYSWFEETGANFDLDIAESNLVAATDYLVEQAPPAHEALIINLGDFFHADNSSNQTSRSHHALDVDTRWAKVLRAGIRTMRRLIERALTKHALVKVICEIGNHDDHSSIMLATCLDQYYARETRVKIDTSPAKFHWHRFGDCLIGVTHGDTVKAGDLLGVMAHDRAKDWGETFHRHWYCGHVHHDSTKEYPGVSVETMRTLAPRDAWHTAAGYRSCQDMKLDVWHKRNGRVRRAIVNIRQIWDAQARPAAAV